MVVLDRIKDPLIPVPELKRDEMPEVREIVTQAVRFMMFEQAT